VRCRFTGVIDFSVTKLTTGPLRTEYFPMELDGKKIEADMRTTAIQSTLTTDVTRSLYGWDDRSEGVEHSQSPDGQVTSHYRAMAITNDGLHVNNARIELLEPPSLCRLVAGAWIANAHYDNCEGNEAPLHLGLDVISKLHLFVQARDKMMFYTAANATRPPPEGVANASPTATPEPAAQ
jgi:hypothetical protein